MVEVRSDDDDLAGTSRQETNDVRELRALHGLFRKVLAVATSFHKQLFQCRLSLLVVAFVFPQPGFDDFSRNWIVADGVSSSVGPGVQQHVR